METKDMRNKASLPNQAFREFSEVKDNLGTTKVLNATVGKVNEKIVNGTVDVSGGHVDDKIKQVIGN